MPSREYEDNVSYELARRARCCVSWDALRRARGRDETGCARGVPINRKAIEANGGSRWGIGLRLPCDAVSDPLFTCPWFEETGIERAKEDMIALREAGARTLGRLARQLQKEGER